MESRLMLFAQALLVAGAIAQDQVCSCDDSPCTLDAIPDATTRLACTGLAAFPGTLPASLTSLELVDGSIVDIRVNILNRLDNLETFDLSNNKIDTLPSQIANMPALTYLNVSGNLLCGSQQPDLSGIATVDAPVLDECTDSIVLCSCESCCEPVVFDSRTSASFSFTQLADADKFGPDVADADWSKLIVDDIADVDLTHMKLVPIDDATNTVPAGLDCSFSKAVVRSRGETNLFKTITLETLPGNEGCLVNLDRVFQSTNEYQVDDLEFVYFLDDLAMTSGKVQVYPVAARIITMDEVKQPNFIVETFMAAQDAQGYTTTISLRKNTFTVDECPIPSTVTLQIGGGCTETLVLTGDNQYEYTIPPTDLAAKMNECITDPLKISETGTEIVYGVDATLSFALPAGCVSEDKPEPTVAADQATITYHVRLSNGVEATATTDVNQLVMNVLDYEVEPCNDRIVPMGKVRFNVSLTSSLVPIYVAVLEGAKMGDVDLSQVTSVDCSDETSNNGNYACTVVLATAECMIMSGTDDGETCSFDFIGPLDIRGTFRYSADFEETLSLKDPTIANDKTFTENCPVVADQVDVTGEYPVQLAIDGSNLNNPIKAALSFVGLDDSASVTLRLLNVQVSMENGAYQRSFAVEDKVQWMAIPRLPWYADAHFCRYDGPTETDNECSPFYDATRSNPFFASSPDVYLVSNKGYVDCQANDERATDSFIFTPNNWVFAEWTGTTSTMTITVTAEVDTCSTPMTARRRLQGAGNGDEASAGLLAKRVVQKSVTVKIIGEDETLENPDTPRGDFPYLVVAAGAGALVVFWVFVALYIRRRRRNRDEPANTQLAAASFAKTMPV